MKQVPGKDNVPVLFMWCYIIWIFSLSAMISLYDKGEAFLFINHSRNKFLDIICSVATYMGDGLFALLIIVVFILMKQRKIAWMLLASFLLSGLICLLLKRIINEPRPIAYFSDPNLVAGVKWMSFSKTHGFPSGHTTSAFALASVITLSAVKKWVAFVSFFLACLIGYSRIYLGQHFVGDILAGSIIGGISGYLCVSRRNFCLIKYGFGLEQLYRRKMAHD